MREDAPLIQIHIPEGADIGEAGFESSYRACRQFLRDFFPAYANAEMQCTSWLLASQLNGILGRESHILSFQSHFEILEEEDSSAYQEWIFGKRMPPELFSENTSLQRRVKVHVLSGGKVSWSRGRLKEDFDL